MIKTDVGKREEADQLDRLAHRLDAVAVRLARGRPAIDVALGEIFIEMAEGGHIEELCFAKKEDFANEALGIPPRTFYSLCELAAGLRSRGVLRQAVLAGEVTPTKARVVMDLATGEDEGAWTAAAMEMTEKDLKAAVRERSGEEAEEWGAALRTIRFRMTAEQQDRLDYAHSLAKQIVGYDAPRWKLTEAVAREWLARDRKPEPDPDGEGGGGRGGKDPVWLSEMTKQSDEVSRQLRAVFEAGETIAKSCCGVPETNALGLLARATNLLARRERFDEPLGRVLARISQLRLWWLLGFETFGDYCRERLGISASTARQRIRLERRLRKLPSLREAMKAGRITYSKALLISSNATPLDVDDRIAEAASTTHQKVKERVDREDREAERESGEREEEGPREAMDVVLEAIRSARRRILALGAESTTDGEAMTWMANHFVEVHEVRLKRADWRNSWERGVLMRHGGLCAVPGCTRAARDIHHIIFQSMHGPDEPVNCVAVCRWHHARCIHRGLLTVRGRGGEHLVWRFEGSTLTPWAEFETLGDDDVRVADSGRKAWGSEDPVWVAAFAVV